MGAPRIRPKTKRELPQHPQGAVILYHIFVLCGTCKGERHDKSKKILTRNDEKIYCHGQNRHLCSVLRQGKNYLLQCRFQKQHADFYTKTVNKLMPSWHYKAAVPEIAAFIFFAYSRIAFSRSLAGSWYQV